MFFALPIVFNAYYASKMLSTLTQSTPFFHIHSLLPAYLSRKVSFPVHMLPFCFTFSFPSSFSLEYPAPFRTARLIAHSACSWTLFASTFESCVGKDLPDESGLGLLLRWLPPESPRKEASHQFWVVSLAHEDFVLCYRCTLVPDSQAVVHKR